MFCTHKKFPSSPFFFSHFTYELSGGSILITARFITESHADHTIVHCRDRNLFGTTNRGMEAIIKIIQMHHCSPICESLDFLSHKNKNNNGKQEQSLVVSVTSPMKTPTNSNPASPNNVSKWEPEKLSLDQMERDAILKKFRSLQKSLQDPLLRGILPLIEPNLYLEQPVDLPAGIELKWKENKFVFFDHFTQKESEQDPRGFNAELPPRPNALKGSLRSLINKVTVKVSNLQYNITRSQQTVDQTNNLTRSRSNTGISTDGPLTAVKNDNSNPLTQTIFELPDYTNLPSNKE